MNAFRGEQLRPIGFKPGIFLDFGINIFSFRLDWGDLILDIILHQFFCDDDRLPEEGGVWLMLLSPLISLELLGSFH
jgi:hypothetical protein